MEIKGKELTFKAWDARGAQVNTSFDSTAIVDEFNARLWKNLSQKGLVLNQEGGPMTVQGRCVRIDEGNRVVRYFLGYLAGAGQAALEMEGELVCGGKKLADLYTKSKSGGLHLLGGAGDGLLKICARNAAYTITKQVLKGIESGEAGAGAPVEPGAGIFGASQRTPRQWAAVSEEWLKQGVRAEALVAEIVRDGYPQMQAEQLVGAALRNLNNRSWKITGCSALLLLGGILVTLSTYLTARDTAASQGEGTYFVWIGAVICGLIGLFYGLRSFPKAREDQEVVVTQPAARPSDGVPVETAAPAPIAMVAPANENEAARVFVPPASPQPQPSGLATASLAFGILTWTLLPLLGALAAIVTGHLALRKISAQPETAGGRGRAVGGLVLGYLQAAFMCLVTLIGAISAIQARLADQFGAIATSLPTPVSFVVTAPPLEEQSSGPIVAAEPPSVQAEKPLEARLDWFRQDGDDPQTVFYCLTLSNPGDSQAQYSSHFRITAYDAAGSQLGERSEVSGWVFPGQSLPVAGAMSLNVSGEVDRLEVIAEEPGRLAEPLGGKEGPLAVASPALYRAGPPTQVVGAIRNNLDQTIMGVDVTALAYDASGNLVDAALERLRFIPAGQQAAIEIYFHIISEPPARVELYPQLSDFELFDAQANPLVVEKTGAQLSGDSIVQSVFVFQNHAARAYAGSFYRVSLYDAQGQALAAAGGEIAFMPPGSRTARINHLAFPKGAAVSRVDVQMLPRPEDDSANQDAAGVTAVLPTFEGAQYTPKVSEFEGAKVTVLANNPSGQTLDSLGAAAVLYDASGLIVGGGETNLGILPAGGQTPLEIRVEARGEVAQVEVLPIFYSAPAPSASSGGQPASSDGPQNTPAPSARAPQVLSSWFAPNSFNSGIVDFAFLIENPNLELELHDLEYQAVLFDAGGLVLGSTTGYIDLLPAGGRLGEVAVIIVENSADAARVEVSIADPGQSQPAAGPPALLVGAASYAHYQEYDLVTGMAENTLDQEVSGVQVNALVFDATGQIVGAGRGFGENFVPAGGATPLAVRVYSSGEVARAELYPVYTWIEISPNTLEGIQPLQVSAAGYAQSQQNPADVLVAFVVENPNSSQTIYAANYVVSLYDQAHNLLATATSEMDPLSFVYPGGKAAMDARLNVPGETQVDRVEVSLGQGQVQDGLQNPLRGDKPAYFAEPFPKVTGLVLNTSAEEFKRVNVVAVLYDSDDRIIGGGSTSIGSVPANGQVPVEIMVNSAGAPARVELYPGIDTFGMNP